MAKGAGLNGAVLSPTGPNLIDASGFPHPGVCDPTNPVISSDPSNPTVPTAYYRAVAEVDRQGNITVTPGNAYSGDNGRAAKKGGNGLYYMAGNDNSGNLSKKQLSTTIPGVELVNATGAELLTPSQPAPVPPNIGMIGRLLLGSDKPGKDTNFRGLTIFDNTLYVSKGSGGNGVNSVYQAGSAGVLPTGTAAQLATEPLTFLPGFPTTGVSTFPFGMWFANATTLYVCDEGDGTLEPARVINGQTNVASAYSLANAGVQKWVLRNGTWVLAYVLQDGLDIGVPYGVPNYPAALDPATGGCRNMTGQAARPARSRSGPLPRPSVPMEIRAPIPTSSCESRTICPRRRDPPPMAVPMAMDKTDWGYSRQSQAAAGAGEVLPAELL